MRVDRHRGLAIALAVVLDEWPESLIVSHLSDIHEPIDPNIFSQYIMQTNFLDPDFSIATGDSVQSETNARSWICLQYSMLNLEFPSYLIPGNHDYVGYGGSGFELYGGKLNYTVIIGDFIIIALDSSEYGYVKSDQIRWAENQLAKYPDKVKIIGFHHSILGSEYGVGQNESSPFQGGYITVNWENITEYADTIYDTWKDAENKPLPVAQKMMSMINEYDVRVIFNGHVHRDVIYVVNDRHYFVTTSTTGGGLPPGERYGSRLVKLYSNGTVKLDPYAEARLDDPPNNLPTGYVRYVYGSANDFTETAVSVTLENKLDMGIDEGRLIFKVSDSKPANEYSFVGAQPARVEITTSAAGHVFDAYFDVEPKGVLRTTLKAEDDEEAPMVRAELIGGEDGGDPTVNLTVSDGGWGLREIDGSYSTDGGLTWTPVDTSIEPVLGGDVYDITFPEKTFIFTVPLAQGDTILVKAYVTDYAGNAASYESPALSPQSYILSLESTPIEVSFTVDGDEAETPYSETLMAGEYTLSVPETVTVGGEEYSFQWWGDGETGASRTLDLGADTELSVIYQKVEAEEPEEPEEPGGGIPIPIGYIMAGILLATATLSLMRHRR